MCHPCALARSLPCLDIISSNNSAPLEGIPFPLHSCVRERALALSISSPLYSREKKGHGGEGFLVPYHSAPRKSCRSFYSFWASIPRQIVGLPAIIMCLHRRLASLPLPQCYPPVGHP